MLVIKRRIDESFHIGDDCRVRVLNLSPTTVTLGIEAPRTTAVWRDEVLQLLFQQARDEADANDGTPRRGA